MHFAVTWVKALYSLYQITKWLSDGPNEVYSLDQFQLDQVITTVGQY